MKNILNDKNEQNEQNILITGCAGFIGGHLAETLLKQGHTIYGIDINISKNLQYLTKYPNFHFEKCDIVNTDIILRKNYINTIIHLAANAGVRNSILHPTLYMRTNIEGTTNLLEQAVKCGIKKFIYASSSSVYGLNHKLPFNENDNIDLPNSQYAVSKKCCEIIADYYHRMYGIETIGLRFFTVYGPRGRTDMAPYKFLNAIMNKTQFDKYGDGNSYRDYTYIDDIIDGIIKVLHKGKTGIYNLGNSNKITLNEFIQTCENITGNTAIFKQHKEQKGDVPYTLADISKAKNELNYQPKTNIKEGLTNMYNWMKTLTKTETETEYVL